MWYKIKPFDTLFFRDGRPFTMGGETWANQIFPPYPTTVYGAIRSWLVFEYGGLKSFSQGDFKDDLGDLYQKGSLSIDGPILALDDLLYFPIPQDMLILKNEEKKIFRMDVVNNPSILISKESLDYIFINKSKEDLENRAGWLNLFSIKDYLENKKTDLFYLSNNNFYEEEKKTGIKRNRITLNAKEGHLYRISMIRLKKNVSFYINIKDINHYKDKGTVRFGGEGKLVKIEKVNEDPFESLKNINFNFQDNRFKIYLATPAIFENGWIPKWINKEKLTGTYKDIDLKLVACSLGKFIQIGGWDLANQKPKPMYRAVPAGSVYYFEVLDDSDVNKIKEVFHLKNISDIYPEEGYGLSLVGGI